MRSHSSPSSPRSRALVVGGAGFVGSHLCEALLKRGFRVICADNFSSGSIANIQHLITNPKFECLRHDIVTPLELEVDFIFNLACPASPVAYQADPIQTTKTSVLGALNLLELARKHQAVILQASTSEVYGDPLEHPQREDYWGHVNCTGIRACYDEGKRCAESLFFDYARQYGLEVKVIRIFNTYGPRMARDDGRVVSNFITQALAGTPITVYGDGSQTRSLCYVDDLIDGIIKMMETPSTVTGPINLGNPDEVTIAALAEMIVALTGSRSSIGQRALPLDDPKRRCPDIGRAAEHLQWQPTTDLETGLRRTIQHFEKVIAASEGVA
jgi:UDP-glucuronate decarboxylase